MDKLSVAIVGSRGIPAKYGGFETFAEEIATRLVKKGFSITVSCEYANECKNEYRGVKLTYFPFPPPKSYFLRKIYENFSDIYFMYKLGKKNDILYLLGAGAGSFLFIPKLFRTKVIVNIAGVEWKRDKFNKIEKALIQSNTVLATLFSEKIVIDAKALKNYVCKSFYRKTVYVPYGIERIGEVKWNSEKVNFLLSKRLKISQSLVAHNYWLSVARLQPSNNIHTIIQGFLDSKSKKPLVVVGDFTSKKYGAKINEILKKDKDKRILMVGGIYDKELLFMLRQNCFGHIHGHSVGGTNPSLLEAMIMKNLVIAHDNEFNREVGGDAILYFRDANELAKLVKDIENNPDKYIHLKKAAYDRVKSNYSWDDVVDKYERVFEEMGKPE